MKCVLFLFNEDDFDLFSFDYYEWMRIVRASTTLIDFASYSPGYRILS